MRKMIISHNVDNQLFHNKKEAEDTIRQCGYIIDRETYTMPCSFSEQERTWADPDLCRDDELAISCFVLYNSEEELEPVLFGWRYDYVVRDTECGHIIESVNTEDEGKELIEKYEIQDKNDGVFKAGFYECVEL